MSGPATVSRSPKQTESSDDQSGRRHRAGRRRARTHYGLPGGDRGGRDASCWTADSGSTGSTSSSYSTIVATRRRPSWPTSPPSRTSTPYSPRPGGSGPPADAAPFARVTTLGPSNRLWLANTDADSVVPRDWLIRMVDAADAGVQVVLGTVAPDVELPQTLRAAWIARHQLHDGHPHIHGANLGIRADTYLALGGWREDSRVGRRRRPGRPRLAREECSHPAHRFDPRHHQRARRRASPQRLLELPAPPARNFRQPRSRRAPPR